MHTRSQSIKYAALCAALVPLVFVSTGCGGKKGDDAKTAKVENAADAATPVRVGQAKTETVVQRIPVTGSISALQTVNLSPKITAKVVAVAGREGTRIKAGETVVQQDTSDLQIQLQQAEANVQAAQARVASARTNVSLQAAASKSGVADAQQQVKSAEQQLELAKRPQRTQEVAVAKNTVAQAQANFDRAQADRKTYEELVKQGASAQITLDQYITQEQVQKAALDSAKQQLSIAQTGGRTEQVQTARAALLRAQSALRLARANTQQNSVRQDDVRNAEALLAQARAQSAGIQKQISDASIVSPIDGVIAARQTEPGQLATPVAPVMQLVRLQNVYFEAQVPETDILSVSAGKPVGVSVDAYPGKTFMGKVAKVYPVGSTTSRTFRVRVEVPNDSGSLRPGMFAQGSVSASSRQGVVVPKDAVVSDGENEVVYVANGNTVQKKVVQVGIQTDTTAEIKSGVSSGDTVVVAGQTGLKDGGKITIKQNEAQQSASAQNAPAGAAQ